MTKLLLNPLTGEFDLVASLFSELSGTVGVANGGTGTSTAFTQGSVVFSGASGVYTQDNTNFFWDNTNKYLGLGINSPSAKLHLKLGASGATPIAGSILILESNVDQYLSFINPSSKQAGIVFSSSAGTIDNYILAQNGVGFTFATGGSARMSINASGFVGINSSAARPLTVSGTLTDAADESFGLIAGTISSSTNDQYAFRATPLIQPGAASVRTYGGLDLIAVSNDASATNYLSGAIVFGFRGGLFGIGNGLLGTTRGLHIITYQTAGGSITNAYGVQIDAPAFFAGGSATNETGILVNAHTSGTTSNAGIIVDNSSGGTKNINLLLGTTTVPAGSYSFYSASSYDSYFAGNLLIGTATINANGTITKYSNVTTAGWGVPAIYGRGRSTAQTAAVASVAAYTVGAADGSFLLSANLNVTTSTTFSINVQVAYTDETNTAQTLTLNFQSLAGTLLTAITNIQGVGPYEGLPVHIRAKAATSITIKTAGTFTSVTYNVEGNIQQIA